MNPAGLRGFEAILLHDMPGMDFRAAVQERPEPVEPPRELVAGLAALIEQEMGFVALHHALAAWPGWPAYAELLGGAFLYRPRVIRGELRPGSAYAPGARYEVTRAHIDHPVLAGVPDRFELSDEAYRYELFMAEIEPLLWRGPVEGRFLSAMHTVRGLPDPCERSAAPSPVPIGWATSAGKSPVVVLQPGDVPGTFAHPVFGAIVGNALRWVASPEAREWAEGRHRTIAF